MDWLLFTAILFTATYMTPLSTKAIISSTGVFVAIAIVWVKIIDFYSMPLYIHIILH